jgi:tungstate transport system ATP-binding protein
VLELAGVRHRYGDRIVLDLDAFAIPPAASIAVVGPNGSGKSTLLRLCGLLERPTEGQVRLGGLLIGPADLVGARRRITLVEQRPLLFRGTTRDNVTFGLRARRVARAEADRRVSAIAERLALTALLERSRAALSEGEIQRVAVARALVLEPDILLLDEPVSSADRAAAQMLYRVLEEERTGRGLAICLASHQLEDAYRWADDIRALADGRLSPVTPENLFRVELPAGEDTKHVRVRGAGGPIEIAVVTDRTGPAILAVPPTDVLVSCEPIVSSARNVFRGRVTRLSQRRAGAVQVAADIGVELVAVITEEAARDLRLTPGGPVTLSFKASAVQVF